MLQVRHKERVIIPGFSFLFFSPSLPNDIDSSLAAKRMIPRF